MFLGSLFILQFFMARAHGHKAFLYLSGCPLVKIQPGYKKRLLVYMNHLKKCKLHVSVGAEKVVLDNVCFYILEEQLLLFTGVPLPSFNFICKLRKVVSKMTNFGVASRETSYRVAKRYGVKAILVQIV